MSKGERKGLAYLLLLFAVNILAVLGLDSLLDGIAFWTVSATFLLITTCVYIGLVEKATL